MATWSLYNISSCFFQKRFRFGPWSFFVYPPVSVRPFISSNVLPPPFFPQFGLSCSRGGYLVKSPPFHPILPYSSEGRAHNLLEWNGMVLLPLCLGRRPFTEGDSFFLASHISCLESKKESSGRILRNCRSVESPFGPHRLLCFFCFFLLTKYGSAPGEISGLFCRPIAKIIIGVHFF